MQHIQDELANPKPTDGTSKSKYRNFLESRLWSFRRFSAGWTLGLDSSPRPSCGCLLMPIRNQPSFFWGDIGKFYPLFGSVILCVCFSSPHGFKLEEVQINLFWGWKIQDFQPSSANVGKRGSISHPRRTIDNVEVLLKQLGSPLFKERFENYIVFLYPPRNWHIPPLEKENHRQIQMYLWDGRYVSSLEVNQVIQVLSKDVLWVQLWCSESSCLASLW